MAEIRVRSLGRTGPKDDDFSHEPDYGWFIEDTNGQVVGAFGSNPHPRDLIWFEAIMRNGRVVHIDLPPNTVAEQRVSIPPGQRVTAVFDTEDNEWVIEGMHVTVHREYG